MPLHHHKVKANDNIQNKITKPLKCKYAILMWGMKLFSRNQIENLLFTNGKESAYFTFHLRFTWPFGFRA